MSASNAASPAAAEGTALQEIVITAERREESLDKVPISVTAFSQRTMDDLHIQSFADLATIVPGLIVTTPQAGNQENGDVAIRGIFANANAPTTQFYIDETPVAIRVLYSAGPSGSPRPMIFDLDHIEVLRGPQGTLFGSSAMGGAIRFITPQPGLDSSSGFAKADVSYTDTGSANYEAGAAYGAPIIDGKLGFRVSAWYQNQSGFIDKEDPYTGAITQRNANYGDNYVIRPAFTWAPNDGLTITPAFMFQHVYSANPNTYWLNDDLANPPPQQAFPNADDGRKISGAINEPYADDLRLASVAVKWKMPWATFQSDTSWLDRTSNSIDDFTRATEFIFGGVNSIPNLAHSYVNLLADSTYTHAVLQEFRLSSADPSARLTWVGGLFYRHAHQQNMQFLPGSLDPLAEAVAGENTLQFAGNPNYVVNGVVYNGFTQYQAVDISEAAFGEVTLEVLPRLKANVGVRVEHSIVEHQSQVSAGAVDGVNFVSTVSADQVGNPITPRYGLTWQYTDNDMVYVSAAKGYRAGGGNGATVVGNSICGPSLRALGLTSAPDSFASDGLWSYEIGAKDSLFDHRLAIEASAFYIDWSNIQTTVSLPSCAEGFTTNRGKAISDGFDLQAAAILAEGLKLNVNVGYTNAYYPNAAYGAPSNGVVPLLNAAGDKLPNVLPWTASANAEYSRAIDSLLPDSRGYLRLDYRWLSAANALNPNAAGFDSLVGPYQNPEYSILNVRLGVLHEGWDVSLYADNITRSDPTLRLNHDAGGDPILYSSAIRPLTFGVTAYYRY
ncbi:MAG TPA: TonB-dependent receptor [Steroidobacteraceae bacterium]|nr:TonB-dependent receptor [Steroidobacteraceae bacterium]